MFISVYLHCMKMSKYGVFSGPYLDTFHAVLRSNPQGWFPNFDPNINRISANELACTPPEFGKRGDFGSDRSQLICLDDPLTSFSRKKCVFYFFHNKGNIISFRWGSRDWLYMNWKQ